jgi:uncharacterized protein (DUF169 family)
VTIDRIGGPGYGPAMISYESLARTLVEALSLPLPPVAVSFVDEIPAGVPAHRGSVAAGCAFWQEATAGAFATSAADHALCAVGMYTHNLARTPAEDAELSAALQVFADLGYVRAEDVPRIPVLAARPKHIVYAPLASAPAAPDVVLLFVKPSQSLILAEAAEQVDGGLAPSMGRPACAVVPQVHGGARPALSLGCCGARAYVDALADDTALYALPGPRLDAYVARIAELSRANVVLTRFHQIRRKDVAAGGKPTIAESLGRMA